MLDANDARLIEVTVQAALKDQKKDWLNSSFVCTVIGGIAIAVITWQAQACSDNHKRGQDKEASLYDKRLSLLASFGESSYDAGTLLVNYQNSRIAWLYNEAAASSLAPSDPQREVFIKRRDDAKANYKRYTTSYITWNSKFRTAAAQTKAIFPDIARNIDELLEAWDQAEKPMPPAGTFDSKDGELARIVLARCKKQNAAQMDLLDLMQRNINSKADFCIQEMGLEVNTGFPALPRVKH